MERVVARVPFLRPSVSPVLLPPFPPRPFRSVVLVVSRNAVRKSNASMRERERERERERQRDKGSSAADARVLKLRATSGIVLTDRGESSRERSPLAPARRIPSHADLPRFPRGRRPGKEPSRLRELILGTSGSRLKNYVPLRRSVRLSESRRSLGTIKNLAAEV
jgi:hypothetical protein